ncbi:unnamed protein product, partial [Prorocentrum cordatum]
DGSSDGRSTSRSGRGATRYSGTVDLDADLEDWRRHHARAASAEGAPPDAWAAAAARAGLPPVGREWARCQHHDLSPRAGPAGEMGAPPARPGPAAAASGVARAHGGAPASVEASLQSMGARLQASLQAAVASASSSMSQAFQTAILEMAQRNDSRFQAMEDRIVPMEEKMGQVDQMQKEIQKLKEELVVLNTGVPAASTGGNWDRTPDPAVVTVFAKIALSKQAVEQALAPLVAEAQLNDHVVLEGDAVSHELALKKIKQGIEGLLPHKLFVEKDAAALSMQWAQLLRVQIESPSSCPQVLWNRACIRKFNLDKDALAEEAARVLRPEFASWNTRAFASYLPRLIKGKLRYLQTHWRGPVVLGLQETHAGLETMQQLLGRIARDFVCFASSPIGAQFDAGGVATVFPAQVNGDRITYSQFDAVPGRALKVTASMTGAELRHWNARNHGFTADVRTQLLQHIRADLAWAHAAPTARAVVVVGGDVLEQEVFGALPPGPAPSGPRAQAQRAWEEATRMAVDLAPARATRWHQGLRRASRIDKVLVSVPRWALCQLWQSASVCGEPRELHINEVSDHAMIIASIAPRAPRPRSRGPAPFSRQLVMLPRFREIVELYCAEVCWGELAPPDAHAACVTSLQAAAKLLQNELLTTNGGAKGPNAAIWRQLARAFWRQDAALARVVMAQNPWANDVIELGALGQPHRVTLKDPAEFERRYTLAQRREAAANSRAAQAEAEEESAEELRKRMISQGRALRRRAQLWAPRGARQHLAAVDLPHGAVTTQEGMAAALAAHWKPVFDPPKGPVSERRKARLQELYLERFATPAPEWDALPPPGPEAMRMA